MVGILCLLESAANPQIRAIVALSQGIFPAKNCHVGCHGKSQQACIYQWHPGRNLNYLQKMAEKASRLVTLFQPEKEKGVHGAAALTSKDITKDEYWFALMMFFKKLV